MKQRNMSKKNPQRNIVFNTDLYKMLQMNRDLVNVALTKAYENGFIESNTMDVRPTDLGEKLMYMKITSERGVSMTIQQKKEYRFKVLDKIYTETNGSINSSINVLDLGRELCLLESDVIDIVQYLNDEHLISKMDLAGFVSLTHNGIIEIENAKSHPDKETHYFPPVNIINNNVHINGDSMATIQIGNTNSNQNVTNQSSISDIQKWIEDLEKVIQQQHIQNEELINHIDTIKLLTVQKKPNNSIIHTCLLSIKEILMGVASNAAFQALLAIIPK